MKLLFDIKRNIEIPIILGNVNNFYKKSKVTFTLVKEQGKLRTIVEDLSIFKDTR